MTPLTSSFEQPVVVGIGETTTTTVAKNALLNDDDDFKDDERKDIIVIPKHTSSALDSSFRGDAVDDDWGRRPQHLPEKKNPMPMMCALE